MATPKDVLWDRDPHTAAKHEILRGYLAAWFPIMAAGFGTEGLTYVDAFAGPGEYKNSKTSSPVIALTQAHRRDVTKHYTEQRLLLIEKNPDRYAHLKSVIAKRFPAWSRVAVECRKGECLSEMIPALHAMGANDGPIFVNFDGWGVDTPASMVRHVGHMNSAEALVTFQTSWFMRFVDQAHKPAGDKVFGGKQWRARVRTGSPAEKKSGLVDAYRALLADAGFDYQLDFELVDEGGHELILFFGTSSEAGLRKMKEAMWKVDPVHGQQFRDPKDVNQLSFDIEEEPDLTVLKQQLLACVTEAGEITLEELKTHTLHHTVYRPPQATHAVDELVEDQELVRETKGRGHRNVYVRLAPLRLF